MNARILVACANGAGTSLMMKMTAERVTKKLGMGVAVIGLRNVLSDAEMEQHLVETGAAEKFKA